MEQEQVNTNETTQNEDLEQKKKEKKIFIARMIGFTLFGAILPFIFIAWRFDIFRVGASDVSPKISLSGWGLLGIIVVYFFIRYCMNVLKRSIPYSLTYQIVSGFIKVIMPLILVYAIVVALKNSFNVFQQALFITICCEAVAIIINPLPKYMHDKGIEHASGIMDLFIEKWKNKGDKQ